MEDPCNRQNFVHLVIAADIYEGLLCIPDT